MTRRGLLLVAVAALLLVSTPAYALRVGWNVDIHQGDFDVANDFHLWGILESGDPSGANPPTYIGQVNFIPPNPAAVAFPNFAQHIGPPMNHNLPPAYPGPRPPVPPFYYFEANWSGGNIPFCTWVHFGLEFDETCHNIGYWLQGAWTKNGVPLPVAGTVPILGFMVDDLAPSPFIRIQNASGSGLEATIVSMDIMALNREEARTFELVNLNTSFFDNNPQWNDRWAHVPTSMLPTHALQGDGGSVQSFFDVFVDQVPNFPGLELGQNMLLARESVSYYDVKTGKTEYFWNYEMHMTHLPEPGTMILLGGGLLGLLARRKRK